MVLSLKTSEIFNGDPIVNVFSTQDFFISKKLQVCVFRNFTVESIFSKIKQVAQFHHVDLKIEFSEYDDSYSGSFQNLDPGAIIQIWLDARRYSDSGFSRIIEQLKSINSRVSITSIFLIGTNEDQFNAISIAFAETGIALFELNNLEMGDGKIEDRRLIETTGSPINPRFWSHVGYFVCHSMLNRLVPTKKILAVDLDGTLHGGVVGEDLFSFENFHRDLVKQLKEFKRFGMITVLVSKNDLTDVQVAMQKKLLDSISTEDFDYLKVGWGSKSDAISEVIDELKFGSDSVIFIDDNPAELIDFERNFPSAIAIRGGGPFTVTALKYCPGVFASEVHTSESRNADLKANFLRTTALAQKPDHSHMQEVLGTKLTARVNANMDINRVVEMSHRTNQFNLSFARFQAEQFQGQVAAETLSFVTIAARDNFSNSGIIASLVGNFENRRLHILEFTISCRALGRGLESQIFAIALESLKDIEVFEGISATYRPGPRNEPMQNWLKQIGVVFSPHEISLLDFGFFDVFQSLHSPATFEITEMGKDKNAEL